MSRQNVSQPKSAEKPLPVHIPLGKFPNEVIPQKVINKGFGGKKHK
ncbi:hypothetical protein [Ferroacidibacillus organovorans]|nr:hypothetical protein [Ferroacidibacillus organovorans]